MRVHVLLVCIFFAVSSFGSFSVEARQRPQAFLKTNSGYVQPDTLVIGNQRHKTSNVLMSTFDIAEFEYVKEIDPNAYQALHNHHNYGIVGTRGLFAGVGAGVGLALGLRDKVHPAVPVTAFLAGFIYYLNCRYMARHYLHNAINTINGVKPDARRMQWNLNFVASENLGIGFSTTF